MLEGKHSVVKSRRMVELASRVEAAAQSDAPVLITGETGVGKEVVARSLHAQGPRANRAFVALNCGGIPETLFESTLFGYERGAFTGAMRQSVGAFGAAEGGTLLLDEIGELPPRAQASLLRVLDSRRITRLGGCSERLADVRVIAATNKNLEYMVKHGRFRSDLWYRIGVIELAVPPLRARREDVRPLAHHFLENCCGTKHVWHITEKAAKRLELYDWPGNVRQLRNAIEHAITFAEGKTLKVSDLPRYVAEQESRSESSENWTLRERVAQFERNMILQALSSSNWSRTEAARRLGLPVRTLNWKLRQYREVARNASAPVAAGAFRRSSSPTEGEVTKPSLDVIAPDYDEHGILDGLPALPMALGSRVRH